MKQFLTALAANFVTIALCVALFFFVIFGVAAALSSREAPGVRPGSVLVINLDDAIADSPTQRVKGSPLDNAFGEEEGVPIRSALQALHSAIDDNQISGVVIRGSASATGYGALREFRNAIVDFRNKSKKPVHAFLVNPETKDYYVASAASVVTMDPFGSLVMPGLAAEEVFLTGMFEKYGIGVQVTRVGRFKAAVEPMTRKDMSPENRLQTRQYLSSIWTEVLQAISETRKIDTASLQKLVDEKGIIMPNDALAAGLIDRIGYFDTVLVDLHKMVDDSKGTQKPRDKKKVAAAKKDTASDSTSTDDDAQTAIDDALGELTGKYSTIPQVTLADYGIIATNRAAPIGASNRLAIVYASGDIVDGEGGAGMIGGDALARDLRRIRRDKRIKAVVLRINSPGGSAVASETILRELKLIAAQKPIVVSMGSVAASGGYWITTAATRIFAEPNTITGSIGVFGLIPNIKTLANNHGVTFDTVKTGRYADIFSISRPRSQAEMDILQRSTDAIYNAFIERVSTSRKLSPDSVRQIAEGRVWAGTDAMRIGLVDSLGGLETAVKSAASLGKLTGDYAVDEYPRRKGFANVLNDLLSDNSPPLASISAKISGRDAVSSLARDVAREFELLVQYNDPRNTYARLPFILRIR